MRHLIDTMIGTPQSKRRGASSDSLVSNTVTRNRKQNRKYFNLLRSCTDGFDWRKKISRNGPFKFVIGVSEQFLLSESC